MPREKDIEEGIYRSPSDGNENIGDGAADDIDVEEGGAANENDSNIGTTHRTQIDDAGDANSELDATSPSFAFDYSQTVGNSGLSTPPMAASLTASGPELISDAGPLHPASMLDPTVIADAKKKSGDKLEQVKDDGPVHPGAFDDPTPDSAAREAEKARRGNVEQMIDNSGPVHPGTIGDEDIANKKTTSETTNSSRGGFITGTAPSPPVPLNLTLFDDGDDIALQKQQRDRDSICLPRDEEGDTGALTTVTTPANIRSRNEQLAQRSPAAAAASNPVSAAPSRTSDIVRDPSQIHIPDAYLVENDGDQQIEDIVISGYAEPLLPWWKKKRVVFSLLFFAAAVVAIAAGVGVSLSRKSAAAASATQGPTASAYPSSSLAPSSSPTACALKISTNKKKLDIPVDNPFDTKVALDGQNAVVVTRESGTRNVHIIFYLLKDDTWEKGNHYIENDGVKLGTTDTIGCDAGPCVWNEISAAISGKVALVGFPFTDFNNSTGYKTSGGVLNFEQNALGVWEKRDEHLQPQNEDSEDIQNFGYSIGMDGDLACVVSPGHPLLLSGEVPAVHVFQHNGDEWKQIRRLNLPYPGSPPTAKACFIAGDTIAVQINDKRIDVYEYDQEDDVYYRIQDPLKDEFLSISFDQEYLVYSKGPESFLVYQRQDRNQPYTPQPQINLTNYTASISGAANQNRMLVHDIISVSGYEASLSHDKDIIVVRGANQTHFYVQDIGGRWEEVSLSLDQPYNGYHVSGRDLLAIAHNVTTNEDEVYYFDIEDCERSPTQMPSISIAPSSSKRPTPTPSILLTYFATPRGYGAYPTSPPDLNTPSPTSWPTWPPGKTSPPTTTQWPTPVTWPPNFTPFPTEASPGPIPTGPAACYWIEINISFDAYPKETSWQLMNTSNDEMLTIENSTAYNSTLANGYSQQRVCLTEGDYEFIIYDQDGLCCLYGNGSYNLTSDEDMIREGGAFQFNETTLFSVPFSP